MYGCRPASACAHCGDDFWQARSQPCIGVFPAGGCMPFFISTLSKLSFSRNNGCPARGLAAPDCAGKTFIARTASPVAVRLVGIPVPEEFAEVVVLAGDAAGIGPGLSTARVQA